MDTPQIGDYYCITYEHSNYCIYQVMASRKDVVFGLTLISSTSEVLDSLVKRVVSIRSLQVGDKASFAPDNRWRKLSAIEVLGLQSDDDQS